MRVASYSHQWTVRPMTPADVAFVAATWKNHFWDQSPWGKRMRWQTFVAGHGPIVDRLLTKSLVLVAEEPEDKNSDGLAGSFVYEPDHKIVHWAYVKPHYRRAGAFASMLAKSGLPQDLAGVTVTHGTWSWFGTSERVDRRTGLRAPAQSGLADRFPSATYIPYIVFQATERAA